MSRITGKQCRQARSLLKWNLNDLASHVKSISPKRIDSFEHGLVHLVPWENEEIGDALKKAGIAFRGDFEVTLSKDTAREEQGQNRMAGEGARIVISADEALLSGAEAENAPAAAAPGNEDEKKKKKQ